MPKFIVITYDDDEQQLFFDWIVADTKHEAEDKIGAIRKDTYLVDAISLEEWRTMAEDIAGTSEEAITAGVHELARNMDSIEEEDFYEGWHEGPSGLWFGSNPNCVPSEPELHCPCGNLDCTVCGGNADWEPGDPHVR